MIDPETGRARVRLVDIDVDPLRDRAPLHDPHCGATTSRTLQSWRRLAKTARLSEDEFRRQFEHLVAEEPPALVFDEKGEAAGARLSQRRPTETGGDNGFLKNGATKATKTTEKTIGVYQ